MQVFDYGNWSTPARTYTNTYLTGSNYTSRYIFNRLLTSTVTDGTHSTTLATNVYDNSTNSYCTGGYSLTNVSANEHDNTNYGTGFAYRGNPAAVFTPSGTRCISYDIAGNVVTHNNNGLTTSVTTTNNFAVPQTITTNSLSSTMSWQPFLGLSTAAGPNGDTTSVTYDANARPQTSVSTLGATTSYTYNDSASPPNIVATTNGHWVRTTMDGFGRTIKTETGNEYVIEAGASNPHNPILHPKMSWGKLIGQEDPVNGGVISGNLRGTNPRANHQVGGETGPGVCAEILMIQWEFQDYEAGVHVPYAPLPNGTTTFNSNSFTFTLLWDIGLGDVFTPFVGWAPGWGQLVPGLH